jgi:hypothetical protein
VNRRALLGRTVLLWAAAPAAPAFAQGIEAPATANDAEVLHWVLQLEELQASLYRAALELDLGVGLRSLAIEYAAHGREHVEVLSRELRKLGAEPEERPRFGFELGDRDDFRRVAREVEDIVVGAYNGAIPSVLSSYVRILLARIVHVEAQHAASFASLGRPAAPESFDAVLSQAVVVQRIQRYTRA